MGGIHIGVQDKHAKLKFLVGVISLKFVYSIQYSCSCIIPRVVYGDILEFWRLNTYKKKLMKACYGGDFFFKKKKNGAFALTCQSPLHNLFPICA
jgi:hypothetical protein